MSMFATLLLLLKKLILPSITMFLLSGLAWFYRFCFTTTHGYFYLKSYIVFSLLVTMNKHYPSWCAINKLLTRRTRSLRSSTSHQLDIPAYRLESIGHRSFPVAASTLWNTLPSEIQSSPSLTLFRQRLKTYLFQKSFPDVLLRWLRLRGPRNNICYSGKVKYFSDWLIDWFPKTAISEYY